jgi:hypothetical protein
MLYSLEFVILCEVGFFAFDVKNGTTGRDGDMMGDSTREFLCVD